MKKKFKEKYSSLFGVLGFILFIIGVMVYNIFSVSALNYLFFTLSFLLLGFYVFFDIDRFKRIIVKKGFQKSFSSFFVIILISSILVVLYLSLKHYPLTYDFTDEKRFSLSEQTINLLKNLKRNVVIKVLAQESIADQQTVELLKNYNNLSSFIRVEYFSHLENPGIFKQYNVPYQNGDGVGSLIFEYEINDSDSNMDNKKTKHFVLSPRDLYKQSFDPATRRPVENYQGESKITSILTMLADDNADFIKIAYSTGHGEADFNDSGPRGVSKIANALSLDHYKFEKINLLTASDISLDFKVLIIAGLERSFQDVEIDKIKNYLSLGGNLLFLADPSIQGNKASLDKLTSLWGIYSDESLVVENHRNYGATLLSSSGLLRLHLPRYSDHEVVRRLSDNKLTTAFIYSRSFLHDSTKSDDSIVVKNLLQTTEDSWLEKGGEVNKFDDGIDVKGPLNFALAVNIDNNKIKDSLSEGQNSTGDKIDKSEIDKPTNINDNIQNDNFSRVILIGDSDFIRNNFSNIGPFENNKDFFLNCVAWLSDQKKKITIRPKQLKRRDLLLTQQSISLIYYVVVIFIPLSIIFLGIYVYNRRKKKSATV